MDSTEISAANVVKKTFPLLLGCLFFFLLVKLLLISSSAHSSGPTPQERKIKLKTFKDIPVAINIVRNLQSETWHKDLEIEVKNISEKPIYFMLAYLVFNDEKIGNGETAIRLTYGDPKKHGRIDRYGDPADEHLAPGDTYVFPIPEIDRKGLKAKHEKFPERTKNLMLEFTIINFGDGTGFEAGRSMDFRGEGFI